MKYVRLKHWRGVGVRALRTIYIDVIVKEKRDRQESRAVRDSCVESYHWLNLLASVLIAQNPPWVAFIPQPWVYSSRSPCRTLLRTASIPTFLICNLSWTFQTLLICLPPNHEYCLLLFSQECHACACFHPTPSFNLLPCVIGLLLFALLLQLLPSFAVLPGFFYPTLNTLSEP